jgi:primosomal protein N' (replication factor Y)
MTVLRVALDVPLRTPLDYVAAPQMPPVAIGAWVRVPFGRKTLTGVVVDTAETSEVAPDKLRRLVAVLDLPVLSSQWLALCRFAADYYQAPLGMLIANALPPGLRRVPAVVAAEEVWYALDTPPLSPPAAPLQRALLDHLAGGPVRLTTLRETYSGAPGALNRMQKRAWVQRVPKPAPAFDSLNSPLTPAQQAVSRALAAAGAGFRVDLLHGVTGSGKTRVYLERIAHTLAAGRQVLLLVPEINLTPQLRDTVQQRFFRHGVILAHSALSEGERSRGWLEAAKGRVGVVLGTRLAVFAAFADLGLIVVDEEHDPAYKQQDGIRYSARDLALMRGKLHDIPVLLGSATPSLESLAKAERGDYRLHTLDTRAVAGAAPPIIRLVDTRQATLSQGLAPALIGALAKRLERGEQSLVYLNRRGYAPVLYCPACGWVAGCPRCDARRVFHRAGAVLVCHQCGYSDPVPRHCPMCGNADLKTVGRGTQRIEEGLTELFPGARVLRVDRDSMTRKQAFSEARSRIAAGEVDILVGTQMLAKGHDYPRLTLVGVLEADRSLYATDFRAPERLFAQLLQVAGRAGRADLPGEVLIQTDFPHHPLLKAVLAQDYRTFAQAELAIRQAHALPPFTHLVLLRAEHVVREPPLDWLREVALAAAQVARDEDLGITVYDPVPALLSRRAERHRAQLLLAARSRKALQQLLSRLSAHLDAPPKGLHAMVDVDPLEI